MLVGGSGALGGSGAPAATAKAAVADPYAEQK
jgi:hypothetical protein